MKTILVIEDTLEMRENITEILQLFPYQVLQATNGKEGIELARQTRPDLILCDIMMPDLDGYGVLYILGKDPILADVPFLFLTAKAELADVRSGLNLGADDYLTKPFDALSLLNSVALRLRKRERGQTDVVSNSVDVAMLTRAILNEPDARQSLREYYPTRQFIRKHQLYTAGSYPIALYYIRWGKVKQFITDMSGNEYITTLHGADDFVGYQALLADTAYAETVELLDDAEVCSIPKADFLALIDHHQAVSNRFNRLLAAEVAQQQERLLKLAYQPVRKRVAEALLLFQRKFYAHGDADERGGEPAKSKSLAQDGSAGPNTSSAMTLSRENWSQLVGASYETVIRILGDLRAEGLIELTASQITLLDINKLTHLKR